MKKPKNNNLLIHILILVAILATAKSAEAEITMEAAFQGHCGHTSPCEQLCYEIHDGMYECDCIEGYELNKNGYSCQVINSTANGDGVAKSEEDVLYQKGASFSAKLANDNERDNQISSISSDGSVLTSVAGKASGSASLAASLSGVSSSSAGASMSTSSGSDEDNLYDVDNFFRDKLERTVLPHNVNSNDYYISGESMQSSRRHATADAHNSIEVPDAPDQPSLGRVNSQERQQQAFGPGPANVLPNTGTPMVAEAEEASDELSQTEAILNSNMESDYYSKQDMSIYDDVNNNQLNLRPLSSNTYQSQKAVQSSGSPRERAYVTQHYTHQMAVGILPVTSTTTTTATTTATMQDTSNGQTANISNIRSSARESSDSCNLDCGLDGVCDSSDGGGSRCLCPFGKTGVQCLDDTKVRTPKFSKSSWLAFPALRGAYKHVQIRVEFRPESFDGIILLSGERDDLTGDFMALLLNKGFVEFWFDCGSGVGSVRSRETILLNEWNSVIIYRHRWDAWLVLNHGTKVQGRSNGLFSRITFREPVFLGGTGNITGLAKRLPVYSGFVGCIRRFVANEHDYKFEEHPLGDVTKGFDIQECATDKCFRYPCQHGGKCLPTDTGAVCLCPIGYVGDLCEIRMDLEVPAFNGSSFLRYAPLGDSALIWLELKVIIKPAQLDGLILYTGPEKHGDFIALSLNDGFVEFTFDLGSGPAVVKSEYPISLGQWHTIRVSRTARLAVLKIDRGPEVMTISSNGFWHLSLPENLFVGGMDHVDKLPLDLKYQPFFAGCIQRIEINGHTLAIISEALGGTNIGNCPHACVAHPCGPLAECVPQMESYECRCSTYNAQCNKAAEVPLEELQLNKVQNRRKVSGTQQAAEHEAKAKKPTTHKQKKLHSKEHRRYLHKYASRTTSTDAPTTTTIGSGTSRTGPSIQKAGSTTSTAATVEHFEDDIIFRDVHAMHKKFGISKGATGGHAEEQRKPHSSHKRSHISKHHHQQGKVYHGAKSDPYQKHPIVEHKLSKLPTHYESFQTNPESDILTFADSIDFEPFATMEHPNAENLSRAKEASATVSDPFVFDESLFDQYDDTEDYQRKQLAQDMQRIMSNKPPQSTSNRPKVTPVAYDYSEEYSSDEELHDDAHVVTGDESGKAVADDNLLEPVAKTVTKANQERQTVSTTTQSYTDWSLLKKLDLSADHQSQIGVRKNFGACFAGKDSYFHYNDADTMSQIISYNIDLNLRIKTHSHSGVILWTGRQGTTDEDDDYLSLGIEDGFLHFRYDLGSGEIDIRFNATKVSDGLWHRVRAIRDSQEGYLEVDGRKSSTQCSPGKLRQLNTDTGLYVGGMPDVSYFTRRKYDSGIVGCISEIILAGELKLNFDPNTLGTAHNVETGIL